MSDMDRNLVDEMIDRLGMGCALDLFRAAAERRAGQANEDNDDSNAIIWMDWAENIDQAIRGDL